MAVGAVVGKLGRGQSRKAGVPLQRQEAAPAFVALSVALMGLKARQGAGQQAVVSESMAGEPRHRDH